MLKKWIKLNLAKYKKKYPEEIVFVIDINGEVAGSIGFHHIRKNHKAEIGYWLAEKYWNKGIMTRVVKLMTKFGFEKLKFCRIHT